MSADVVIRGGTVIDGTGAAARTADVAIEDGVITEVGAVAGKGRREIDADGAVVTPGFVDVHTHYDGQATWDARLQPSSLHGVTTVVMGNCGIGFAPARPSDRDKLIELMEGVEDIPGTALHEGLPWTWETIEEYLEALDTPHDIDFATQVMHGPLRVFAMGERGVNREPATPEDIAEMGRLAAAGVRAGALGFTTSRTMFHKTRTGDLTPDMGAARAELVGIAEAVGETGAGILQVVSDFDDVDDEVESLYAMMRASGRPLSISLLQFDAAFDYRRLLAALDTARAQGLQMSAGVGARAIGVLMALDGTVNPWVSSPTFRAGADLRDPAVKHKVLAEVEASGGQPFASWLDHTYEFDLVPDYEPDPRSSVGARAHRDGRPPFDLLYDLLLEGPVYTPFFNYFTGDLEPAREMLQHPYTHPSLSDGGAHVGTICDGSFPTTLLAHWARDRTRGPQLELPWLVQQQCRSTAELVGLLDRGLLAPGYKADVNVIDFDNLKALRPYLVADLPAGGRRVMQEAEGYLHTFVSGVETYTDGKATEELPGRLVRGAQSALTG